MTSLFESRGLSEALRRIERLRADSPRAWGTMSPAQMCAHCSIASELALGDRRGRQALLGKLLSPFVKSSMLGSKPFPRNSPTSPLLVVTDARDFEVERRRLVVLVTRFGKGGPSKTTRDPHLFFGRLSGEQWGALMSKHLGHHLAQFGV